MLSRPGSLVSPACLARRGWRGRAGRAAPRGRLVGSAPARRAAPRPATPPPPRPPGRSSACAAAAAARPPSSPGRRRRPPRRYHWPDRPHEPACQGPPRCRPRCSSLVARPTHPPTKSRTAGTPGAMG
eukprot:49223-Chlamydomonas_euryale.AAC.3